MDMSAETNLFKVDDRIKWNLLPLIFLKMFSLLRY